MIEGGMRARKVAEILDRSESTVSRFLKRYQKTGNIENKHRSGRPKLITERGARKLSKIVKTDRRQSLQDTTHEFNASNVQPCSTRTIQRNVHSLGYNRRFVCKTIVVRKVNRKRRMDRCRLKLHWTINNQWKHITLSDKMMIVLEHDGKLKVWRKASEKCRPECWGYMREWQGSTLKLMVWGCVTYFGRGTFAFINGNMNSKNI